MRIRAGQFADERSLKPLKDLNDQTGCGANKRSDCYPCLRGSSKLEAAINQAQMNKAPRYGGRQVVRKVAFGLKVPR